MKSDRGHHSILTRFTLVTILALTLAFAISYALLHNYNVWSLDREGDYNLSMVDSLLDARLDETPYDDLFSSKTSKEYDQFRMEMREICIECDADNLYLYTVNEDRTERTYLFAVSSDPERDATLKKTRNLGDVSSEPLSEDELRVLNGDAPSESESVDNAYGNNICLYKLLTLPDDRGAAILGLDYDFDLVNTIVDEDTLAFAVPMFIAVLVIVGIELILLNFHIIRPIRTVSASMREFAQDGQAPDEPLEAKRNDEIGEIVTSFNQMTTDIEHYVEHIEDMTAERVAASTELQVAQRIQQSLVPAIRSEEGAGYEAYAFARTAREVGGDFYDLTVLDEDRLLVVMADVSGKGVSAALYMSMCLTLLHSKLQELEDPAAALNETNDVIESNNTENMFVTTIAGIFDQRTSVLTYANAGHTRPLLSNGTYLDPDPGIAIGLFEDSGIVNETVKLEPGEGILLYTDGAVEATNAHKQFFGEQRLATAVRGHTGASDTVRAAVDAVDTFVADAEQFDDLTLLALFAKEREAYRWKADLAPVIDSFELISDQLRRVCDNRSLLSHVMLACDEAFTNVASYSGATQTSVEIVRDSDAIVVTMTDDGMPFDPLENEPEDKEFDELEFGGMGIKLIKQTCTEVTYEYANGRNVLSMSFHL